MRARRTALARVAAVLTLTLMAALGPVAPAGAAPAAPTRSAAGGGGPNCDPASVGPDGQVHCSQDTTGGGSQGGRGGGGSTGPEAMWNAWCVNNAAHGEPYQPGYRVDVMTGGPIDQTRYDTVARFGFTQIPVSFQPGKTYILVVVRCYGAATTRYINALEPGNLGPVVDVFALREQAKAQITVPQPVVASNPPFDQPGRFGVVRVPTWFWIEPGGWAPLTGSASLAGITVTVTATPQQARWRPGDGTADVVCAGPGTPWRPGLPDSATTCSHTFTSSSADRAGAAYHVQVTTTWEFTWAIDGADQGAFGTATPTVGFSYQVGEIQAIGSH